MKDDIIKKLIEDIESRYKYKDSKTLNKVEECLTKEFKQRNIQYDVSSLRAYCAGIEFSFYALKTKFLKQKK